MEELCKADRQRFKPEWDDAMLGFAMWKQPGAEREKKRTCLRPGLLSQALFAAPSPLQSPIKTDGTMTTTMALHLEPEVPQGHSSGRHFPAESSVQSPTNPSSAPPHVVVENTRKTTRTRRRGEGMPPPHLKFMTLG